MRQVGWIWLNTSEMSDEVPTSRTFLYEYLKSQRLFKYNIRHYNIISFPFYQVTEEDAGIYKCVAMNDNGEAESEAKLSVTGKYTTLSHLTIFVTPKTNDICHKIHLEKRKNCQFLEIITLWTRYVMVGHWIKKNNLVVL